MYSNINCKQQIAPHYLFIFPAYNNFTLLPPSDKIVFEPNFHIYISLNIDFLLQPFFVIIYIIINFEFFCRLISIKLNACMFQHSKRSKMIETDSNDGTAAEMLEPNNELLAHGVAASVTVSLHPLVIMNICDHFTRIKAQEGRVPKGEYFHPHNFGVSFIRPQNINTSSMKKKKSCLSKVLK